eukprot:scaffold961_cov83-Skeletonema_dohrnii-CCMP3373.AAC.1
MAGHQEGRQLSCSLSPSAVDVLGWMLGLLNISNCMTAPKRLPSTYGDQSVPSRPQGVLGHTRAPPGSSSPFSTDPQVV